MTLSAALWAQGKGKGRGKQRGAAAIGFSVADRDAIWDYYQTNPNLIPADVRALPPGLARNLQRGKPLPPGWQKKMAAFPSALDGRLGPLPGGYRRVVVDRWAFVIANTTNVILDVIDLMRR